MTNWFLLIFISLLVQIYGKAFCITFPVEFCMKEGKTMLDTRLDTFLHILKTRKKEGL